MQSTTIAVDVAKEVLEVAVSVRPGQVSEHQRLSRTAFLKFCAERQPATVLLETCGSAHYWGRQLQALGHRVVLLPAHATRPYVFRNKTDSTDTRGLLEAYRNDQIHPVPVGDHLLQDGRAEAPHLLRDVHRPEPLLDRPLLDAPLRLGGKGSVLLDLQLARDQLLLDEAAGPGLERLQGRSQLEIHGVKPPDGGPGSGGGRASLG